MKKIINPGVNVVEEMLSGYLRAYSAFYERVGNQAAFMSKNRRKNKVSIVTGGGSGHEPTFGGFCGKGLADAVVCGNVFTAPNPQSIYEAAKAVDEGHGVLFLYGNYSGDNLNFDMAEELCRIDGIKTAHVRVWDDCASAPPERTEDRRGIAGLVFMIKIAGAACDAGFSLEEVVRVMEKARRNVRSIGVAISPASIPNMNRLIFELGEDEMEYGVGIHGEPGVERIRMMTANALVERMYFEISSELGLKPNDRVCVLVNSLGSTTLIELGIVYKRLSELLDEDRVIVHDAELKTYCTSQEMGGVSVTIFRIDDELRKYYDMPCYSPYYAKGVSL